jgi:hypothetical protein
MASICGEMSIAPMISLILTIIHIRHTCIGFHDEQLKRDESNSGHVDFKIDSTFDTGETKSKSALACGIFVIFPSREMVG